MALLTSCNSNSLKKTIQNTENAVFTIYTYDTFGSPMGSGTGFFISETGEALTNYHVLDGAVKAYIETNSKETYEIKEVLLSDKRKDIAKFQIDNPDNKNFSYLNLSDGVMEKGDEVIVIGSPLDYYNSVTTGIISALRADKRHGNIIQISAPISSGNSGSPVMSSNGDVIGIATFVDRAGQNINFAVAASEVISLTGNDFSTNNRKFNLKEDFIIMNLPSDGDSYDIVLNAIEFGKNQTTAYFTYTNVNLIYGKTTTIWNELGKGKDKEKYGFHITDLESDKKYYIVSSTIGATKAEGTEVELCDACQFQVYFPAIKKSLNKISICNGDDSRAWMFTDIDLSHYRHSLSIDVSMYKKLSAMSQIKSGELGYAYQLFNEILNDNPSDVECLNGLALLSYIVGNKSDSMYYLDLAIEEAPLNVLSYLNRSVLLSDQEKNEEALSDLSKAIEIDPAQPDYHYHRAKLYCKMEKFKKALEDMDTLIQSKDFKKDAYAYYLRALIHIELGNKKSAKKDIYTSFQLTNDKELEKELNRLWQIYG